MNKPSKYQQAIYDFIVLGKGNAIVEAVAGSGKTTTILNCAKLIPENSRSIFVAFNKSIATELNEKLPKNVPAKTLHSLGYSMFFQNTNAKTTLDNDKLENVIKLVLSENKIYSDEIRYNNFMIQIKMIVSLLKSFNSNYKEYKEVEDLIVYRSIECDLDSIFYLIGEVMDKCKAQTDIIDFDDMIWIPVVNNFTTNTYDYVFVDEVQDLNKVQFELIKKICNGNTRIIAVGDSSQSIYAFRGADTDSMDNFKEYFNAQELPLSICYRCAKSIVRFAKEIMPEIEEFEKSEEGSVDSINIENIISNAQDGDMILCRTNAPLIRIVFALIRNDKKAIIRGADIAKKIIKRANQYKVSNLEDLLIKVIKYRDLQNEKLILIEQGKYDKRKKNFIMTEIDICDTLLAVADNVTNIEDLKYKIQEIFSDKKEGIVCSSVHKAKGLEADNVFILNYHLMPHPMAETPEEIQQEMNIKYVAITRAKKNLYYSFEEFK